MTNKLFDINEDWVPDSGDPLLYDSSEAPHEPPAVRRLQLAQWDMTEVRKIMNLPGTQLMRSIEKALTDENTAHGKKLPIHTGTAPKGYK